MANISLQALTFSASQPRWRISWLAPIMFQAASLSSDIILFMRTLVTDCMDSNQAWAELESEHRNTTVCFASGECSSKCLQNKQRHETQPTSALISFLHAYYMCNMTTVSLFSTFEAIHIQHRLVTFPGYTPPLTGFSFPFAPDGLDGMDGMDDPMGNPIPDLVPT